MAKNLGIRGVSFIDMKISLEIIYISEFDSFEAKIVQKSVDLETTFA